MDFEECRWRFRHWFDRTFFDYRKIISWYQRKRYGWNDIDILNLDVALAKLILPRLRVFRNRHGDHPSNLTYDEWNEVLDKMIYSFERISSDDFPNVSNPRIDEGLKLFGEYFQDLWM